MKLLRYLFVPVFLLVIFHLILLPACSEDDDIKAKYDSNLLVSWIGFSFNCPFRIDKPPACPFPEEEPENCPCQHLTSFNITVSNFIMKRIFEDFSEGNEFDFYQGRSYQFNLRGATENNPFVTPDFNATLEPSWYEVVSFQIDDFQIEVDGFPELEQQLNDDLHASVVLPMTIVPRESRPDYRDAFFRRKIALQEGWTRNLLINFSCSESIDVSVVTCDLVEDPPESGIFVYQFTYNYSFDPDASIVGLSGSGNL